MLSHCLPWLLLVGGHIGGQSPRVAPSKPIASPTHEDACTKRASSIDFAASSMHLASSTETP